jgi:hypothetical protein
MNGRFGFGGWMRRWRDALAARLRRNAPVERTEAEPRIVPLRSRPQFGTQLPGRRDARMLQLHLERVYGEPSAISAGEPERQVNRA